MLLLSCMIVCISYVIPYRSANETPRVPTFLFFCIQHTCLSAFRSESSARRVVFFVAKLVTNNVHAYTECKNANTFQCIATATVSG